MYNILKQVIKDNSLAKKIIVEDYEVVYCNLTKEDISYIFDFLNEKWLIKKWTAWSELTLSLEWWISWSGSNWFITTWDFELIKDYLDNTEDEIINPFKDSDK